MPEDGPTETPKTPGRIRRLRNRLPAASVRLPLPAGMDVVVSGPQEKGGTIPTSLANVLLSYLAAANTTTLYLEQKVALLARTLPGDRQENARRLRPLARLAALPQRAATRLLLPPLQSRLPDPAELVGMPIRVGRRQLSRAGTRVAGWVRGPAAAEPDVIVGPHWLLAAARTPALLVVSGSLYSVSMVAYSVHGVAERLRILVWRRI